VRSARKSRCACHSKIPAAYFLTISLAVLVFSGAGASAATISNRDEKDQSIIIIDGDAKSDVVLKPQQTLEKVCPKGCVVRLNGSEDDDYQVEADDIVSIEDGYLYYDAPEASPGSAPVPGAAPAPAPPPALVPSQPPAKL